MTQLRQALMLTGRGVVSLVGAGGKTSMMFTLAREISEAGDPVLTTTTTKILNPSPGQSSNLIVSDDADTIIKSARELIRNNQVHVTVAAGRVEPENKLIGLSPRIIDQISETNLFRWIIAEADGAARKPLKAPAGHEPVVPDSSTHIVGICGLSAVGNPLTETWVHRAQRYAKITGLKAGARISSTSVGDMLIHKNGIFKNGPLSALRIAFLNQADVCGAQAAGQRIVEYITDKQKTGLNRIIIGQIKSTPPVLACIDLDTSIS
jgi:probable selenium-dependent hydroxylase accessory protein YqeC